MNANTLFRDAAVSQHLTTIPVSELQVGMVVHAIARQAGKMGVKHKGEIKHLRIINQLKASGVESIVVEVTPSVSKRSTVALKKPRNDVVGQKKSNTLASSSARKLTARNTKLEFENATELLQKSDAVYAEFTHSLRNNQQLDFTETKELVQSVYSNLVHNPEALLCMSMIMHSSDYIANHSVHVATLLCYFAHQLGYPQEQCEQLAMVGFLFDIGMVKVPESIRSKYGELTPNDFAEIRLHVNFSLEIVAPLKLDPEYMLAIEQHHERLDGSGYPNAYTGSKIHKFSRMLAIVDCYDALTTKRSLKAPKLPVTAMKVLSNPENGYDQKLVLAFIRCMGIYPVGSLVMLSNMLIGLVTKTNKKAANAPVVKVFYNTLGHHFVSPTVVNLAKTQDDKTHSQKSIKVLKPVLASEFGFDLAKILK